MFPAIGIVIVFGSIIAGYLFEEGNLHILFQPAELIIIGGAAIGSLIITCPPKLLVKILKDIPKIFGSGPVKHDFLDLLGLLYALLSQGKKEGLLALEACIEHPKKNAIFT